MHSKLLGSLAVAGLFFVAPAAADASCCDQQTPHQHFVEYSINIFDLTDPQLNPAPPVRQLAEVWFKRPVLVGRAILQGRYVIEHDNDRMARGEPCTHIYPYNDRTKPVAAFHCTHLERARTDQNTVSLVPAPDGRLQVLTEFQFAGETAAHGYPTIR